MSKESKDEVLTKLLSDTWMPKNETFSFPPPSSSSIESNGEEKHLDNSSRSCQRMHRLQKLKNRWDEAIATISKLHSGTKGSDIDDDRDKWFEEIIKRHSSDNDGTMTTTTTSQKDVRFYHTLVHLEEMLEYIDIILDPSSPSCDVLQQHRAVLILSTFFHDIIYNAKSGTNEEDSAALFCQFANNIFETESSTATKKLVKRIESYILATKSHSSSSLSEDDAKDENIKYYLHLFLDIDMSVLGKRTIAYNSYAYAIRQEYEFVPHDTYCEKRAEILETFLRRNNIFDNDIMRGVLEEQCRDNLRREIVLLKRGIIPQSGAEIE